MRFYILLVILLMLSSCRKEETSSSDSDKSIGKTKKEDSLQTKTKEDLKEFSSETWGIFFHYPKNFEVYTGKLGTISPVINVYPQNISKEPPFAIHEDNALTYIAILPEGYGVDGPAGKRMSLEEWEGNLSISLNIDKSQSTVYLLENEEPWGYLLRFAENPKKWSEQGIIFIHLGINDFSATCENASGEKKPMEECDPMMKDVIKLEGNVKKKEAEHVYEILKHFDFH